MVSEMVVKTIQVRIKFIHNYNNNYYQLLRPTKEYFMGRKSAGAMVGIIWMKVGILCKGRL